MVGTMSTWVPTVWLTAPNFSWIPGAISSSGTLKRPRSSSVTCWWLPKPWSPTMTNRVSLKYGSLRAFSKNWPSAQSE
ncbi:hypothetical protein D3C81_2169030 [compost metagenome]